MITEFQGKNRWLSNFWPVSIQYKNKIFFSVEHAYMSEKNDSEEWKSFCLNEKNPKLVKKASLDIELRSDWKDVKERVMLDLTRIKYQNVELRKKLLHTNKQHIQEGNDWGDIFWGVDLATGEGENKLGKIIMKVRSEIQESHLLYDVLKNNKKIILFDGSCNLCDQVVQVLVKNDSKDIFRFVSLQSKLGANIQHEYDINSEKMNSVILIDTYVGYKTKTAAVFSMTRFMGAMWPLFNIFWIVPRFIRDAVYTWVTKNRYQWFGQKQICRIMSDDIRHKFLEYAE